MLDASARIGIAFAVLFASPALAVAQYSGEITSVVGRVNGVPGTDFLPGDEIRVDAEATAAIAAQGQAQTIYLKVAIFNSSEDVVGADIDSKLIQPGTGDTLSSINQAKYDVPDMEYSIIYTGYVWLYWYDGMEYHHLDDFEMVIFITD